MKILIIGGSGMIGSKMIHFFKKFHSVSYTFFKHPIPYSDGYFLEISKKQKTIELISKLNPDLVVHTAALTNVDLCQTNQELANKINVEGTQNIVDACKNTKSKLVYISTSFVFDGTQKEYYENDITSPLNYYGITKEKAEKLILNSGLDYLILRTDQPYCWIEPWQKDNSVVRVLRNLKLRNQHNEMSDWFNNPTYVPDLIYATKILFESEKNGIYHLTGSDFIDRYSWSLYTAKIFGFEKNLIKSIKSNNLNLPAKRPNANLSNKKLFDETNFKMKDVEEGLSEMYEEKSSYFTDL
jgi:dTDP-4-dehydrorhamnose reductase